ncbi:hypothetical protein GDO78_000102 [Eleutherodactylus coqui]|uniref:Uncharacterized protein n=1 Tax=Eleutherodactylus coqui TaxID=57060 RepID=A0A8J6FNW6_ELECQ|nr:hypothetical protein GDO78_000102 [Eleutherodactylus coqui]
MHKPESEHFYCTDPTKMRLTPQLWLQKLPVCIRPNYPIGTIFRKQYSKYKAEHCAEAAVSSCGSSLAMLLEGRIAL